MSENGDGNGNQGNLGKIPHELLIDELVLTMDRGDGTMRIGGKAVNNEVALDMLTRGVRYFETLQRIAAAGELRAQQAEQQRVSELLNRTRGGRG